VQEGSRDDFFLEQFATRETDVVLTTGEVRELLRDRGLDLRTGSSSDIEETPLDPTFWNVNSDQTQLYRSVDTGGSGGYCEHLFRYAAFRLFGVALGPDEPLPYKAQRNSDYRELVLTVAGQPVLAFALAYGFRNIQNLVRKMKMKKASAITANPDTTKAITAATAAESSDAVVASATLPSGTGGYHYVEVMAWSVPLTLHGRNTAVFALLHHLLTCMCCALPSSQPFRLFEWWWSVASSCSRWF